MTRDDAPTSIDRLLYRSIPILMAAAVAAIVLAIATGMPANAFVGAGLFLLAAVVSQRVKRHGGVIVYEMARRSNNWTVSRFEWTASDNPLGRSRLDAGVALAEKHGYRQDGDAASDQGGRFPRLAVTLVKGRPE